MSNDLYTQARLAHQERQDALERERHEKATRLRNEIADELLGAVQKIVGEGARMNVFCVGRRDSGPDMRCLVYDLPSIEFYLSNRSNLHFLYAVPRYVRLRVWQVAGDDHRPKQVYNLADVGEVLAQAERLERRAATESRPRRDPEDR